MTSSGLSYPAGRSGLRDWIEIHFPNPALNSNPLSPSAWIFDEIFSVDDIPTQVSTPDARSDGGVLSFPFPTSLKGHTPSDALSTFQGSGTEFAKDCRETVLSRYLMNLYRKTLERLVLQEGRLWISDPPY